jgi:hypothetical protein
VPPQRPVTQILALRVSNDISQLCCRGMPTKRGRTKSSHHGVCLTCDANNIPASSSLCNQCALLESRELFDRVDDSYHAACTAAAVSIPQSQSLFSYVFKGHELEEIYQNLKDIKVDVMLHEKRSEDALHSILLKLSSCRLSRLTRIALSVKTPLAFVNAMVPTLDATIIAELEEWQVEEVFATCDIPIPLPPRTVYVIRIEIVKGGYRFKLHPSYPKNDPAFQKSGSDDYSIRVLTILRHEGEQDPLPALSYFNTIHKSARDKLTRLVNDLRSLASRDKKGAVGTTAKRARKSSAASASATSAIAPAASAAATGSPSALNGGSSSSLSAGVGAVSAALSAEDTAVGQCSTGSGSGAALVPPRKSQQQVRISAERRESFMTALDESLELPMMQVSVAKPGVDRFYHECDNSSGTAQYTKLLVAEQAKDPYDGYYYAPEAFTSLLFRRASVMKLATERKYVPDHISCIIGEGQAYGPLFYQIGVRSYVFRNLRTLALLVPTVTDTHK